MGIYDCPFKTGLLSTYTTMSGRALHCMGGNVSGGASSVGGGNIMVPAWWYRVVVCITKDSGASTTHTCADSH